MGPTVGGHLTAEDCCCELAGLLTRPADDRSIFSPDRRLPGGVGGALPGRTGEARQHHRHLCRRRDVLRPTFLLVELVSVVHDTARIDIDAQRSQFSGVLFDTGVSADRQSDTPSVHVDHGRPSTPLKVLRLRGTQIDLSVSDPQPIRVDLHSGYRRAIDWRADLRDPVHVGARVDQRPQDCTITQHVHKCGIEAIPGERQFRKDDQI